PISAGDPGRAPNPRMPLYASAIFWCAPCSLMGSLRATGEPSRWRRVDAQGARQLPALLKDFAIFRATDPPLDGRPHPRAAAGGPTFRLRRRARLDGLASMLRTRSRSARTQRAAVR